MPYNTHFSRIYVSYFHLLAKFFICFYAALIRSLEMQHVSPFALAAGLIPIPLPLPLLPKTCQLGELLLGSGGVAALGGRACVSYAISYISKGNKKKTTSEAAQWDRKHRVALKNLQSI